MHRHTTDASAGPLVYLTNQYSVMFTGGVSEVRLPTANTNIGRTYIVHANNGGTISLSAALGDLIDGIASIPLASPAHIKVISVGNSWNII